MNSFPKISLAQINFTVGDVKGNAAKIFDVLADISENKPETDLVIFSELCTSGYPPEDLITLKYFVECCEENTKQLAEKTKGFRQAFIIGTPILKNDKTYNAAHLIQNGEIKFTQIKNDLPNYGVFDEKRVFNKGEELKVFDFNGTKLALLICEDTWNETCVDALKNADIFISINASPYEIGKHSKRVSICRNINKKYNKPVIYLNQFGGQDEVVFDGGSFAIDKNGELVQFKFFEEEFIDLNKNISLENYKNNSTDEDTSLYNALVTGLRDYVNKNGFKSIVLGMSGGVDSAITAAIAADALGSDKVNLVMLPSKFTSDESKNDASDCAKNIGAKLEEVNIAAANDIIRKELSHLEKFDLENGKTSSDLTSQNLQSRLRGVILMAASNYYGHLLLTTGNKSEVGVGYSTLYGDMCGGYNPLKDVYKTKVFELCRWRNANIPEISLNKKLDLIPENIITKAPTAELRENQKDQDNLPEYEVLDKILYALIEEKLSVDEIIASKVANAETVEKVAKLLYLAEYKRRQAAPGVKISGISFTRDRRFPITSKFVFRKC